MRKRNWAKGKDKSFLAKLKVRDKVYIADSEWSLLNGLCVVDRVGDGFIVVSSIGGRKDGIGQGYYYPCLTDRSYRKKTTISLWDPNDKR